MENHQQMDYISKLKEKIESVYYQVTQKEINKTKRLQKLQTMFKIKVTVKTANKATPETLKDKDLILTEINHLIYAAAIVITEKVNGTGCYKSETHSPKRPPWVRRIWESIKGIRKGLSYLAEIERDEMKTQTMKRKRLLRKYNTEKEENLGQVTEELNRLNTELNPIRHLLALLGAHHIVHVSRVNKKYQQRHKDFLDTGKDITSTIRIKCLEETARSFTTFSDRKLLM